jgi:hypothetical protein
MNLWHLTADAPRHPLRISSGEAVDLRIGSWPIEPGQAVWVEYQIVQRDGMSEVRHAAADWQENLGPNSYWQR